jgi:nucleoside-diphosphate-sugar epimerase
MSNSQAREPVCTGSSNSKCSPLKALIIGGTRFLGAAVARELLSHGHAVTLLHRGKTPGELPPRVNHVLGDARDRVFVEGQLREGRYDAVVDTILQARDLDWYLPLLAKSAGQLVHCSSAGVYAPAERFPAMETDPTPCPAHLGSFSAKLAQDETLLDFHAHTGFRVCSLRVSSLIGAGDVPLDIWGARKSAYFQRLADHQPIWIPADGRALLQPVHVGDVARGFRAAMESDKASGQIYNLSSNAPVTLTEYAQCAKELLGSKSEFTFVPMETILTKLNTNKGALGFLRELLFKGKAKQAGLRFLCEHMWVDISKAKRELGYAPKVSLAESLRDSLNWMVGRDLLRAKVQKASVIMPP